jgi:hypothetical protein
MQSAEMGQKVAGRWWCCHGLMKIASSGCSKPQWVSPISISANDLGSESARHAEWDPPANTRNRHRNFRSVDALALVCGAHRRGLAIGGTSQVHIHPILHLVPLLYGDNVACPSRRRCRHSTPFIFTNSRASTNIRTDGRPRAWDGEPCAGFGPANRVTSVLSAGNRRISKFPQSGCMR